MNYYLDGTLIAVGVLDLLECGMSSVYFFFDPILKPLKFGIVGAIYELDFMKKTQKKFENFKDYYLGFYIPDCEKMNYKSDFEPCYILCPKNYEYVLLTKELKEEILNGKIQLTDDSGGNEIEEKIKNGKEFNNSIEDLRKYLEDYLTLEESYGDLKYEISFSQLEQVYEGIKIGKNDRDFLVEFGPELTRRVVFNSNSLF